DQAREIQLRSRRAVVAAGEHFLAGGDQLRIERDLILGSGNSNDHGGAAPTQHSPGKLRDLACADTIKRIIRTAAGELVQRLGGIVLRGDVENVRRAESS